MLFTFLLMTLDSRVAITLLDYLRFCPSKEGESLQLIGWHPLLLHAQLLGPLHSEERLLSSLSR
jgi:hypothetical protein